MGPRQTWISRRRGLWDGEAGGIEITGGWESSVCMLRNNGDEKTQIVHCPLNMQTNCKNEIVSNAHLSKAPLVQWPFKYIL